MAKDNADAIAALRDECRDISIRITTYHALGERTLTLGSSVTFALVGLALTNGHRYALIVLPVALIAIATYVAYINTEVMSLGGYKAALEEKLNALIGTRVSIWESGVAQWRHGHASTVAVRALFAVILAASIFLSIREASLSSIPGHWGHEHWGWILAGAIGSVVISCAAWLTAVLSQARAHRTVTGISRKLLTDSSVLRRTR